MDEPACRVSPRPHGDPVRNTVQPSADEVAVADRAGPADQDEERGLEGVLDVPLVAEHAAADAQDHRTVPRDQGGERRLVAVGDVAIQERALAQARDRTPIEQPVQLVEDRSRIRVHDAPSSRC